MNIRQSITHGFRARHRGGRLIAILLTVCLLGTPLTVLARKGEKNYKRGLQYEAAQMWEKAAEEFALAVAAEPSNAQYQLHYRRAVFNASQVFMQKGSALAERGDYVGAYNAFRRANSYDPVNQLALAQMDRMLRLQLEKDGPSEGGGASSNGGARIAPTSFDEPGAKAGASGGTPSRTGQESVTSSAHSEQLRTITYSGDLEDFIRHIARQLDLNVIFDREFPKREISVELRNITAAQALDYIFLSQGIFFQKLSRRTFLLASADQNKRLQYQQQAIRTFYLSNIGAEEARAIILAAIPPQIGRQAVAIANKSTNSLTVRDTPENMRLIGELLRSIDKERAEVVMDVNIYEVSHQDLLQLGSQLGTPTALTNLGGTSNLAVVGGSRQVAQQTFSQATTALGAAFVVPAITLSALQTNERTRLLASTQVHAFDGEKSTTHIGQRVPVQTASVNYFGGSNTGDDKNPQTGVNQGVFGGTGFPVIQYEKTGLTLEFTPQVFSNLDVQVKMNIKSSAVINQGTESLTPTFTERNIDGTARIQNNRTMMIASVAQNQQTRGRQGIPVLGLIPVLGHLFTAPRRNDQQTDIVIAVTPHVLRAPTITPRDQEMFPSGTLQTPITGTLEAMLKEVDREDQLAAARRLPTNAVVELPDAEGSSYVPAPKSMTGVAHSSGATAGAAANTPEAAGTVSRSADVINVTTTGASPPPSLFSGGLPEKVRQPREETAPPVAPAAAAQPSEKRAPDALTTPRPTSAAVLQLMLQQPEMRVGEKQYLKIVLKTDASLGLFAATLQFDPRILAVRSIAQGNLLTGAPRAPVVSQVVDPEGLLMISVRPLKDAPAITGAGVLLLVEVEALAAGASELTCNVKDIHLKATDGRQILIKLLPSRLTVK